MEPSVRFEQLFQKFTSGVPIKRAAWKGYWVYKYGKVEMHSKDGSVVDIKETNDILFTLSNVAAEDWVVATAENCIVLKEELQIK